MSKLRILSALAVFSVANALSLQVHAINNFDKDKDLLVCQFDNLPDSDDIYAQAALASFLAHPDQEGINYLCVAGAYGTQVYNSGYNYDDTEDLMNLGFGTEATRGDNASQRAAASWVTAHGEIIYGEVRSGVVTRSEERIENMDFASDVIAAKAKPVLEAGGRVFVAEAGQSDITADWVEKLVADGVDNTQSNVIVVQHSSYNRRQTAGNARIFDDGKDDWGYLTNGEVNTFVNIDDGNSENDTPAFRDSSTTYIQEALSNDNPNDVTRAIWTVARRLADNSQYESVISEGGVDFSDHVEILWIFDLADSSDGLHTVRAYWDEYVLNEDTETPAPPPQPESLGLVAHWELDDGNGQNVSDSSGNNNAGSLINGSWSDEGVSGGSLTFQGGNEGIELPASAFDTVSSEVTISLWVNGASNQPIADTVFRALDSSGNRVLNIQLPWSDSQVYWDAGNNGGSYNRLNEIASPSLYKGGWNHWAFTKSADTGIMNIYANGELFASENGNTNDMSGITTAILGGDESVGFSGSIDEVKLFDGVQSQAEIMSLYEEGRTETPVGSYLGMTFAATAFSAESNPDEENVVRDMGSKVGYLTNGSWIRFDDFNFSTGATSIDFSASSDRTGGTIEVRTGSPTGNLIASIDVTNTGNWNAFQQFSGDLNTTVTGVEDLYFVFVDGSHFVLDVESFEVN